MVGYAIRHNGRASLAKILAVLERDRNAGWKAAAIAEKAGISKSSVYEKLRILERGGRASKVGNVYYIAANGGN